MRKLLLFLITSIIALSSPAQRIGDWTMYQSYYNATASVVADDYVFGIYGGNLLRYTPEDTEVKFYTRNDGLNGKNITLTGYSSTQQTLVLVYDDNNIDLLDVTTDDVVNMAQLKNNTSTVGTVTELSVNGDYAILGSTAGVTVINLARTELRGFYAKKSAVTATAFYDGTVYAALESGGILAGRLEDNLNEDAQWKTIDSHGATVLKPFAGGLYLLTASEGLWRITKDAEGNHSVTKINGASYSKNMFANRTQCVLFNPGGVTIFESSSPNYPKHEIPLTNSWQSVAKAADGTFWVADGGNGLVGYSFNGTSFKTTGTSVGNYGPQNDNCGFLKFEGERLLVSGGMFDYYERNFYDPAVSYYENDTWNSMQTEGISAVTGMPFRSVTSMAQDPKDPNHHFAATGDYGLYEFKNGKYVNYYNLHNSPLKAFSGNQPFYVRVDGLAYDKNGYLWMTNEQVDTIFRILKPNGTWTKLYSPQLANSRHINPIMFDSDGRLWAASRSFIGTHRGGLYCLDYNGTIDNTSDDKATFRYSMINEDGATIDLSGGVFCMAQDKTGQIWFGGSAGIFVVENPADYASSDFQVLQVKVPRNDGTNYADYLLTGISCTAVAVDGANRKWIGTSGYGLYLVSPNGQEIIEQFNTENSPLPSDNILSIAVHPSSGEIFIGTDKGLVSYHSEATEAMETLDKDNVKVYPNPVRPGYNGNVIVSGLTDAADVKIMTTGGQAVATGTSTGGTFVWNVRNFKGEPVAAGVYYILVATADGKEHIAAKVVVVR